MADPATDALAQLRVRANELQYHLVNGSFYDDYDRAQEALTVIPDMLAALAAWEASPTGVAPHPLVAHFEKMQGMASRYLEPGPYRDREGDSWGRHSEAGFVADMIYMLDGPEQRGAQSPAPLP